MTATDELMTIGDFARAAGLTAKALRLYDDLGLLRPARVDAGSGYRRYVPAQLERARLVARLRLLGMPLAREVACLRSTGLRRALLTAAFSGQLTGRASDLDRAEEMAGA